MNAPVVISDPDSARRARRLADTGQIPVIAGSEVLGGAGRSEAAATAFACAKLGRENIAIRQSDAACLWIGDHPPREARAMKVPGDKRPYVAVRVWIVETAGDTA